MVKGSSDKRCGTSIERCRPSVFSLVKGDSDKKSGTSIERCRPSVFSLVKSDSDKRRGTSTERGRPSVFSWVSPSIFPRVSPSIFSRVFLSAFSRVFPSIFPRVLPSASTEVFQPCFTSLSELPRKPFTDMWNDDFGSTMLFEGGLDPNNDELVVQIQEMLENLEPRFSSKPCIYRVPEKIRNLNEQAYSPSAISIGPFHHKTNERLKSMDTIKCRYFHKLIARSSISLWKYIQLVKGLEKRARGCYAGTIGMTSNNFVIMMLIDACFIIELLLMFYYTDPDKDEEYLLSTPWLISDICLDLMLLENQIPFFVLDEIFDQATRCSDVISLKALALHFFKKYNINNISQDSMDLQPSHFTDLILIMTQLNSPKSLQRCNTLPSIPNATELREAGVKFQASTSKHLLGIVFERGVLTIPCFTLDDHTEIFIRNLMALELCHYPKYTYIIDYILFMDYLINTSNDINFLVKRGIIVNGLGESNVAADLFNNLCKNVTVDQRYFYLLTVREELNTYCRKPMHKWKAIFKRDYLSTPWKTASTIAAIVLLALTLTQTICSILSLNSFM